MHCSSLEPRSTSSTGMSTFRASTSLVRMLRKAQLCPQPVFGGMTVSQRLSCCSSRCNNSSSSHACTSRCLPSPALHNQSRHNLLSGTRQHFSSIGAERLSGGSVFRLRAVTEVEAAAALPPKSAALVPKTKVEIMELPTSEESDKLLRIRHSVSITSAFPLLHVESPDHHHHTSIHKTKTSGVPVCLAMKASPHLSVPCTILSLFLSIFSIFSTIVSRTYLICRHVSGRFSTERHLHDRSA